MVSDIAKNTDSVRDFKRQSDSLANAHRPNVLSRSDFLKAPPLRQRITITEFTESTIDRFLVLFAEFLVGSLEAG